jgi:hypothetical protein
MRCAGKRDGSPRRVFLSAATVASPDSDPEFPPKTMRCGRLPAARLPSTTALICNYLFLNYFMLGPDVAWEISGAFPIHHPRRTSAHHIPEVP